jgi:hypothetical protein
MNVDGTGHGSSSLFILYGSVYQKYRKSNRDCSEGNSIAGTSAPSKEAHKNYPIYSALHRVLEEIRRMRFELEKIEYPILSAINIGVARTSAPSRDTQGK